MTTTLVVILSAIAVLGGIIVVLTRDVMRLILSLGVMFIAIAAVFGVLGASFVAVAEIFVYVGGVLVLFLFAIMLVHRTQTERPELSSRHDLLSVVVALGSFLMLVTIFRPALKDVPVKAMVPSMKALGDALTSRWRGSSCWPLWSRSSQLWAVIANDPSGGERRALLDRPVRRSGET
jgi:NADH:ubiquinone oxidoreductase subunit 6 (subunit J)